MRCSVFPTRSHEGQAFAETLLTRLQQTIPSLALSDWTVKAPESRVSVLKACACSNLVLFDATVEEDPRVGNFAYAVGPLRHLYHVVIFSRNQLPMNFQGLHNVLSPSSGSATGARDAPIEPEAILSWVWKRVEAVLAWSHEPRPYECWSDDELSVTSLAVASAVTGHALITEPGKISSLTTELKRFFGAYHPFMTVATAVSWLPEIHAKDALAMMFGRVFERIVLEHRVGTALPCFRDRAKPLERLFRRAESVQASNTLDLHGLFIRLLFTGPLLEQLRAKRNWVGHLQLRMVLRSLQGQYSSALADQANVYGAPGPTLVGNPGRSLTTADIMRLAKDCEPKDALDRELAPEAEELPSSGHRPPALGELILTAIRSNERYTSELRARYDRFVSHRTHNFGSIKKRIGDYLVNPDTFAATNEVFTLRARFHLMRLLFETVTRLDRFCVYGSEDYLKSWWTCFELLAFVNARPGNEHRVETMGGAVKLDCNQFVVSQARRYELERQLLYSNPMILPDEHLEHILPAIARIFGTQRKFVRGGVWDAMTIQCVHSAGFEGLDNLLSLERPYHVFIPSDQVCSDRPVDCPSHGATLCPRQNETTPCKLRFAVGRSARARRFVWRDNEAAESSLQSTDAYYLIDP